MPEIYGYGQGYKLHESISDINADNTLKVKENMVFLLRLYIQDVPMKDNSEKKYGITLSDTVLVTKYDQYNLTDGLKKKFSDISYVIEDEEEEKKESEDDGFNNNVLMNSRLRSEHADARNETNRKGNQDKLLNVKIAQLQSRFDKGELDFESKTQNLKHIADIISYPEKKDLPLKLKPNKVYIDR